MEHVTAAFSKDIALSIYSDSRPRVGLVGSLQKGLILVQGGKELIGEGLGFGAPVVFYQDRTYFSGSSTLQVFRRKKCTVCVKQFALNMLPEKRFRKVRLENRTQRGLSSQIRDLYQKHEHVKHTFEALRLKHLSRSIGVHTSFVKSESIGNVNVTYDIEPPFIHVKADFEPREKRSLRKIFLLNEQSAQYFNKYCDSDNIVLRGEKIGAWETVTADWASVSHESKEIGFRLRQIDGAFLHRGREFLSGVLDWVGLDYEVAAKQTCFEYGIEVLGGEKTQ